MTFETVTFRIPKQLKTIADKEAKARGITRTSFFVQAVELAIIESETIRAKLDSKEDAHG